MGTTSNWLVEVGTDWAVRLAIAIAIFIIGKLLARKISDLIQKQLRRAKTDEILIEFLRQ